MTRRRIPPYEEPTSYRGGVGVTKVAAVTSAAIAVPTAVLAVVAAVTIGIASAAADSPSPSAVVGQTATPSPTASPSEAAPEIPVPTPASPTGTPFDSVDVAVATAKADPKVPGMRPEVPLQAGHFGPRVARIHEQLAWLGHDIASGEARDLVFGASTRDAVRTFQGKHWMPTTGKIDKRTRVMLSRMSAPIGVLPRTCTSVELSLCIDKTAKVIRLVRDGNVIETLDARFGAPGMETGEGIFTVNQKSRNHTSSRYRTWMPFAMFFNGDEAVHYSPDFTSVGYARGSHGCVGMRDIERAEWIFDKVPLGTRVYVYWS